MTVQTIDVFDQTLVTVDAERFFLVRGEFIGFLERTAPPDALRFEYGNGALTVPFPEFIADGARMADGAIGWPVPAGAVV